MFRDLSHSNNDLRSILVRQGSKIRNVISAAGRITPLLAFGILFFIMYPGVFSDWGTGYLGGSRGDAGIYLYLERINAKRFFTWPSEGFDLPNFYPWRRGLAFSDDFLLPSLLAKILNPIIGNEALVYNLILVTALVLNGYCTYLVSLKVTDSRPASFFAGFVFMCCPYFVFHRGHPQLQFAFWIPLTLLFTLKFVEKRDLRSATGIGACVVGAFACSVYYAMYCYLLAGVALVGCVLTSFRSWSIRDLRALILANVPWVLLLLPAILPYTEVRDSLGTNPWFVLRRQSPPLSSFIAAPSVEQLWAPYTRSLSRMEGFLFFGFIPLALAIIAVSRFLLQATALGAGTRLPRSGRWIVSGMVIALVFGVARGAYFSSHPGTRTLHHLAWIESETLWVLLLGIAAILYLIGSSTHGETREQQGKAGTLVFLGVFFVFASLGIKDDGATHIAAPELYRYLIALPGFEALRGLSRMGIVADLIFILLSACSLAQLTERGKRGSERGGWLVVTTLLPLVALELHTRNDQPVPANPRPAVYSELSNIPANDAIVALPIGSALKNGRSFMFWNSIYQLWMSDIPNPIINGFSGKAPLFHGLYSDKLDSFPSRESLSILGTIIGARYVITNRPFFGPGRVKKIRNSAAEFAGEIETIACDKTSSCIYRVNPVISTKLLPSKELLLASEEGPRTVRFEIANDGPLASESASVAFQPISRQQPVIPPVVEKVPANHMWKEVVIHLPEIKERVSPTNIMMTVSGTEGIQIRNISVIRTSSPN